MLFLSFVVSSRGDVPRGPNLADSRIKLYHRALRAKAKGFPPLPPRHSRRGRPGSEDTSHD